MIRRKIKRFENKLPTPHLQGVVDMLVLINMAHYLKWIRHPWLRRCVSPRQILNKLYETWFTFTSSALTWTKRCRIFWSLAQRQMVLLFLSAREELISAQTFFFKSLSSLKQSERMSYIEDSCCPTLSLSTVFWEVRDAMEIVSGWLLASPWLSASSVVSLNNDPDKITNTIKNKKVWLVLI